MAEETAILTMILDRLSNIENRMERDKADASDSRRRVHEKLEQHSVVLITIEHRVNAVEKSVDSAAPTLKEYSEYRAKAIGAGTLGRFLWRAGAWLIVAAAGAYSLRHDISAWWHWFVTPK